MTAIQRVRRTRATLGVAAVGQALAWGIAITFFIFAIAAFTTTVVPEIARSAIWIQAVALTAGTLVSAALLWRDRGLLAIDRVALWIEEKIPSLHYSLVTAVENRDLPDAGGIESVIAREDIGGVVARALRRALLPALGAATLAAALLYISPSAALGGQGLFGPIGSAVGGEAGPRGSAVERIEVRVLPPAYAQLREVSLDDPSSVPGLAGSRIIVSGSGPASAIAATLGPGAIRATSSGGSWVVSAIMPARPAALTLKDREFERIIVLEPRPDNPPRIVLTSPRRDTTLRVAQLTVRLEATATDDVGLRGAYFEYLVTTGSGEIFNARTITTPVVGFGGSRSGSISASLELGSLKLGQGDVVSIRAIVQDGNTLSGPGIGTSDTRTFRVARADEYDSVSVEAAAPAPVDSSAISQRMLIQMTEQLVRAEKRLTRAELVRRSTEIGDLEDRIRKRVEAILYQKQEEEGEDAEEGIETEGHSDQVEAVRNPDLKEAHNALWEAVRSLQIAEPAPALPPMRVALKALDRARLANRLYLRGLPPKVIVDLARVRLTGKEKGSASTRTPRTAADSLRAGLGRRFDDALEMIPRSPNDAIRAITLLRVEALSSAPAFAAALNEAIDAFRRGRDATTPLLRARRALAGEPSATPGLPSWSGGW
ncbi:MAG TPA: hypothetical protein VM939_02185 [Gemmatimonadaceae bacterium]|nr:hypothetical protein [Gemmatimonadaceae bacterium]